MLPRGSNDVLDEATETMRSETGESRSAIGRLIVMDLSSSVVWLVNGEVKNGAVSAGITTVRTAGWLITEPPALETTTVYDPPTGGGWLLGTVSARVEVVA